MAQRLFIGNVAFEVPPQEVLALLQEAGPIVDFLCVAGGGRREWPARICARPSLTRAGGTVTAKCLIML